MTARLVPQTNPANREVDGSSLTLSTDDPLGSAGLSAVDTLLRVRAYAASRFTQPNVHKKFYMRVK